MRRSDPDRFLTALFAPTDRRETLLTLYAFNHELARAREVVSQPTLALVRLQFWRDVVEGAHRAHEVATPLQKALERGELDRDELLHMINAREAEADDEIATLADWHRYLLGTAGGVMVAAGRLLGAPDPEALRPLGAAYGVAGVLRSVPILARRGRCMLPTDVLAAHGLSSRAVVAAATAAPVLEASRDLVGTGRKLLTAATGLRLPRNAIAAALPTVLAKRDLRRLPVIRERGTADRLAVLRAWITGHV